MLCLDVNVLVYAHRADLPDNERWAELLDEWANGTEPMGLPDIVLSGFLRLVTNRRVFNEPTSTSEAWAFADQLLAAPSAVHLRPSETHWSNFRVLAHDIDARANDLPDAYLAAYSIDHNATLISADRGFARFSRLRWRHPLDG